VEPGILNPIPTHAVHTFVDAPVAVLNVFAAHFVGVDAPAGHHEPAGHRIGFVPSGQ
jgi:hypothetical protein